MRTTRDIQSPVCETVLVYRLTFRSQWVLCFILLLILSIFIQPINLAFANETEVTEVTEVTSAEPDKEEVKEVEEVTIEKSADDPLETEESITETEPNKTEEVSKQTVVDDIEEEAEVTETANATEEDVENDSSSSDNDDPVEEDIETETEVIAPVTTNTDKAENDVISDDSSSSSDSSNDDSNDEASTATDSVKSTTTTNFASSTEDVKASSTDDVNQESVEDIVEITEDANYEISKEVVVEESKKENDSIDEDFEIDKSTSTESIDSDVPEATYTVSVNDANRYQFGINDCVAVGDGSYYCSKSAIATEVTYDRIYAAQDADGDMEIYASLGGKVTKISDNKYDDLAPSYDADSDTITWHRLINGRYQIIQYALDTAEEIQLTNGTTNSMEPSADGSYVAWQYWDGEDWEIVLFDGSSTTQITDNEMSDVSPSIHDGYVLWTSKNNSGEHVAKVYDIKSGSIEVIEGTSGGSVQNPRFVLVYDTKFDNGDVITKGFDLESGSLTSLTALPGELPSEIPDPEATEEVKALIQNKSSKEDVHVESEPTGNDDFDSENAVSASSTLEISEENTDIDIAEAATTTNEVEFELTEFDLVVTTPTSTQAGNSTST